MATYFSGLDLGQANDFSALVVLEQTIAPDAHRAGALVNRFDVREIRRWQLGTAYTQVIEDLNTWFTLPPLRNSTLVIDRTGVGRGICDMVEASGIPADLQPYTITAGFREGDKTVPKSDLCAAVRAALETRRLRFAEELELRPVLEKELENFRVKVTPDRNETFAAWRDGDKDDLVLALALALWYGERNGGDGLPRPTGFDRPPFDLPEWKTLPLRPAAFPGNARRR